MLGFLFKLVQKLSCVHPETCHDINWRWIHQEDQTKKEAVTPTVNTDSAFCFWSQGYTCSSKKSIGLSFPMNGNEHIMHVSQRYWFYIKEEDKYFAPAKPSIRDYCSQFICSPCQVLFHGWKILCPGPHCWLACSGIWKLSSHIWISKMNRARANARALVVHSPWSGLVPTRLHQNIRCRAVAEELAQEKLKP